ncbi:hypothetical protein FANTH_13696 [Fusarium anthophilum]|uniref:Uncharacterized protein n=1 Tax=Fusarium anthophilum TaxID=48485 RepID=A0A8H4YM92_9HYPO|nr:hypothetical protein FANTH_13696 [Fusarium anthophilum]
MGNAPRGKKRKNSPTAEATPEEFLAYLEGQGDACPDPACRPTSACRDRHLNRYHGLTKPHLLKSLTDRKKRYIKCEFHDPPEDCIKKNINRCCSKYLAKYMKRLQTELSQEISELEKQRLLYSQERQHEDLTAALKCLKPISLGEPITARMYMDKKRERRPNEFVFCSRSDGEAIVRKGPPEIPIIRRCSRGTEEGCDSYVQESNQVLERVKKKKSVDVYDSGKITFPRVPEKMTGAEAIRRFHSDDEPPVNILNEKMTDKEAEDDWMSKIPGYDLVDRTFELAKEDGAAVPSGSRRYGPVPCVGCRNRAGVHRH